MSGSKIGLGARGGDEDAGEAAGRGVETRGDGEVPSLALSLALSLAPPEVTK